MAQVPGPIRAGLIFRVGFTDESLVNHGITHLVEHLALVGLGQQPYRFGGTVEGLRTVFMVEGTDLEVRSFLRHVVATLASLPVDRLQHQAGILRTEAAARQVGPSAVALADRFGTRGWGLVAAQEFGLVSVTADQLQEWSRRWFTADNAVLFMTGSLPERFELELQSGSRMAVPLAEPLPYRMPAWAHHRIPGVGISMICHYSVEAGVLADVLGKRAMNRLRFVEGLSYEVTAELKRLDLDRHHLFLWADGLVEKLGAVRSDMLEVIDQLADEGATPEELKTESDTLRKNLGDPNFAVHQLDLAATDDLLGRPFPGFDRRLSEIEAMDGKSVGRVLQESVETALFIVPESVSMLDPRFTPLPNWSTDQVSGREYRLRLPGSDMRAKLNRLVLGDDGITRTLGPGKSVTVHFRDCALANIWNDGSWSLIGTDGWRLHINPADWKDGSQISETLERYVPAELRVAMGDRPVPDPESLVVGPPQKAASAAFFSPRRDSWWLLVFIIVSVRLWYAFDPHPFMSGVNPTASFLSGMIWIFGIVVSVASLYFLYWTYWPKRRRPRR